MEEVWQLLAIGSCIGVWIRFWPFLRKRDESISLPIDNFPSVSIIVPARNEAKVIATVLNSLLQLKPKAVEIIVVDDNSDDATRQIAEQYPVKVISAPPRPEGWAGKNWACHIGATTANGDLLLFTDADTIHCKDSLHRAVRFLKSQQAALISTHPYHLNQHWWEKLLGPFYCLLSFGSLPHYKLTVDNAYAVGQYLLIEKNFYHRIGGHAAIPDHLAEDASLAKMTLANGGIYKMYNGARLFEVQMYDSFTSFVKGWTRLLRLGMQQLNAKVILLTLMPLISFDFVHLIMGSWIAWITAISTLLCFAMAQRKTGKFSIAGLLLFPFPVLFFVVLACYAAICEWMKVPITWRGRIYFSAGRVTAKGV